MKIHESAENYLETIYMLKKKSGYVRAIDIARELSFTKASVSVALKSLKNGGYITVDDTDGNVTLTDGGTAIAEKIYERHNVLAKILITLGVSEETAYEDSCKIEHHISSESFDMIKRYMIKNDLL